MGYCPWNVCEVYYSLHADLRINDRATEWVREWISCHLQWQWCKNQRDVASETESACIAWQLPETICCHSSWCVSEFTSYISIVFNAADNTFNIVFIDTFFCWCCQTTELVQNAITADKYCLTSNQSQDADCPLKNSLLWPQVVINSSVVNGTALVSWCCS